MIGLRLLTAAAAVALAGCAYVSTAANPSAGDAETQVVVDVQDLTDKAFTSDVGDIFAFYRDVASKTARGLTARGVPSSTRESSGLRRLAVRLNGIRLENLSSGSELRVRVRMQFDAEFEGRRLAFSRDDQIQRYAAGVSPADIRDVLSTAIAEELVNDDDLFEILTRSAAPY